MGGVLDLAERLWNGEVVVDDHPPVGGGTGDLVEVADGVAFWHGFSNSTCVDTGDGLLLVDTGDPVFGPGLKDLVRRWRPDPPLRTAVFSHGHIDHVFGVGPFDAEAAERRTPPPTVVAQRALPARFDRYRRTAGYNAIVNRRQFGMDNLQWPTDYRYPDETYEGVRTLRHGPTTVELHAARGETDDHTWTWLPQQRALCCGDLFIWASPNAGNPQKVQRYPGEWADALREMAALGAEFLLPGHGVPVLGADRVRRALTDCADWLTSLHDQTVAMMNAGASLDEIVHTVRPPAHLAERPYLQPVYDEPEFVVRNVWRQYGGWWDGDPASLKPPPAGRLAAEVVELAGVEPLLQRVAQLLAVGDDGSLRLAGQLAQWLVAAAPDLPDAQRARMQVYAARQAVERSTMARGIFGWASRTSATCLASTEADQGS
jgi:alkyl sulfatase BDS1-like metallo-beta-lactamase superfamily hydrolase